MFYDSSESSYKILEITKSSTDDEVKKAYRKKAIEFHPDKNPGDKEAEENFKLAAEAYEVLSDPQKKAKYDQYGHQAFEKLFIHRIPTEIVIHRSYPQPNYS